jgi:hypothetical protein
MYLWDTTVSHHNLLLAGHSLTRGPFREIQGITASAPYGVSYVPGPSKRAMSAWYGSSGRRVGHIIELDKEPPQRRGEKKGLKLERTNKTQKRKESQGYFMSAGIIYDVQDTYIRHT